MADADRGAQDVVDAASVVEKSPRRSLEASLNLVQRAVGVLSETNSFIPLFFFFNSFKGQKFFLMEIILRNILKSLF